MTTATVTLLEVLAECDARGIRLLPTDDGGLIVDAPKGSLTEVLLERLKDRKAEVLAMLRPGANLNQEVSRVAVNAESRPAEAVCRCRSTVVRDVPIHGGQSVRVDCARCGRFLEFKTWYGQAK